MIKGSLEYTLSPGSLQSATSLNICTIRRARQLVVRACTRSLSTPETISCRAAGNAISTAAMGNGRPQSVYTLSPDPSQSVNSTLQNAQFIARSHLKVRACTRSLSAPKTIPCDAAGNPVSTAAISSVPGSVLNLGSGPSPNAAIGAARRGIAVTGNAARLPRNVRSLSR
jgi:hypothetical protein